MARVRVGDIEIDGSTVRIGGGSNAAVSPASAHPQPRLPGDMAEAGDLSTLNRLPYSGAIWMMVGLVASTLGLLLLLSNLTGAATIAALILPAGLGLLTLGAMKSYATFRARTRLMRAADSSVEEVTRTLSRALRATDKAHTIEWIVKTLGLPHEDVVRALVRMRDRDELLEELDDENGEFYYIAMPKPRDLAAHEHHINKRSRS